MRGLDDAKAGGASGTFPIPTGTIQGIGALGGQHTAAAATGAVRIARSARVSRSIPTRSASRSAGGWTRLTAGRVQGRMETGEAGPSDGWRGKLPERNPTLGGETSRLDVKTLDTNRHGGNADRRTGDFEADELLHDLFHLSNLNSNLLYVLLVTLGRE